MTLFKENPHFKVECDGTTYEDTDALSIMVVRPENNISYAVLQIQDYHSENYTAIFDLFDALDISLKHGTDAWTKVFNGVVSTVEPKISMENAEVLEVGAWGDGIALVKTLCDTSHGQEGQLDTLDSPKQIIDHLITDFTVKEFDTATTTGWTLGANKTENVHNALNITFLDSPYLDNFTLINRVCDVATAYAQGLGTPEVGPHWFVDTTPELYLKKIDADHSDSNWDRYYGGSQANATIVVRQDMILYDFKKNSNEYANYIVFATPLRKPGFDYWTEDSGGVALWTSANMTTFEDSAAQKVVGSHSVHMQMDWTNPPGSADFPAARTAAWDLTKMGSINTIPTLNFYLYKDNQVAEANSSIRLATDAANYYHVFWNTWNDDDAVWIHKSLPVGPYWAYGEEHKLFRWTAVNNPDWTNINYIRFIIQASGGVDPHVYVDDLHFSGKIIRVAKDTSEITANNQHQRFIRNDTAVDDSLKQADDSGMAAQLAYAELLRRSRTSIVGLIKTPLIVDALPGQTFHVHACQNNGSFRIDKDMRAVEIRHHLSKNGVFTTLNLTDDVTNSHAFGVPTQQSLMTEYVAQLGHAEAKNLKSSGIDNKLERYVVAY